MLQKYYARRICLNNFFYKQQVYWNKKEQYTSTALVKLFGNDFTMNATNEKKKKDRLNLIIF